MPNGNYMTYDPEMQKLQRQQRYAEMLQQQANEPIPIESGGGAQAPISPFSLLAKALQAYNGRKMMEQGDTAYADLQTKRTKELADMLSKQYQVPGQAAQGIKQTDIAPIQTDIGGQKLTLPGIQADPNLGAISNATQARPTTPEEQLANAIRMQGSTNPMAANMGFDLAQGVQQRMTGREDELWKRNLPMSVAAQQQQEAQNQGAIAVAKAKNELGPSPQEEIQNRLEAQRNADLREYRQSGGSAHGGYANLSPEENDALTAGIAAGRIDASRVNSRTAKLLAGIALKDPEINMVNSAGHAAMVRNASLQRTINVAEALPTVLENVREAGKKLKYSDVAFVGKLQGFMKGQLNDPEFVDYMTQRNDALLSIANVMRGVGMSDKATEMEEQASHPTMSPRAMDAWVNAQQKSLAPRLEQNELAYPVGRVESLDDHAEIGRRYRADGRRRSQRNAGIELVDLLKAQDRFNERVSHVFLLF